MYFDNKFMGSNVRNYPVLKLCVADENEHGVAAPSNKNEGCQVESAENDAGGQAIEHNIQLFSPTTKNVLDEIGSSLDRGDTTAQISCMKRRLDFKKVCTSTDSTGVSKTEVPDVVASIEVIASSKDHDVGQVSSDVNAEVDKSPDVTDDFAIGSSQLLGSPLKKSKNKEKAN